MLPLLAKDQRLVKMSSGYGMRTHPISGQTRFHAGVDVSVPSGTGIVSIWNGKVVKVGFDGGGYGNYIDIKLGTGQVTRFGHLNKVLAREGQTVKQGELVGISGNTGGSTGPHLHFEVRSGSNFGRQGSLDPLQQSRLLKQNFYGKPIPLGSVSNQPSSVARPPGNDGVLRLSSGVYVYGNRIYLPSGRSMGLNTSYSGAKPLSTRSSGGRGKTQVDLEDNHGYKVLADDKAFARALNAAAKELGVPGEALADVIEFESGFNPAIRGGGGNNYVGLIQFSPDAARKVGAGSQAALQRMSRAEQMKYVVKYLKIWPGPLRDIYDIYKKINPGGSQYLNRMGRKAGRKYSTKGKRLAQAAQTVHTAYNDGCVVCKGLIASSSNIVPHKADMIV